MALDDDRRVVDAGERVPHRIPQSRGQPVRYAVAFAPLAGRDPEKPAGVIVLLTAERIE